MPAAGCRRELPARAISWMRLGLVGRAFDVNLAVLKDHILGGCLKHDARPSLLGLVLDPLQAVIDCDRAATAVLRLP